VENLNKKIFEEMRDVLVELRQHCVADILSKEKIIKDEDGIIQGLIKTGEQFLGAQQVQEKMEELNKSGVATLQSFGERFDALQQKFKEPVC